MADSTLAPFYTPPAPGVQCVDFSTLEMYTDAQCLVPKPEEEIELFRQQSIPPGFLSAGCAEQPIPPDVAANLPPEMKDFKLYMGVVCSEDVVESNMFMDEACTMPMQVPGSNFEYKIEFKQGKTYCAQIGGDLVSVTQAGWQGLEPGYEGMEPEFKGDDFGAAGPDGPPTTFDDMGPPTAFDETKPPVMDSTTDNMGPMDTYGKDPTMANWDDPTMDPYGKWDNSTMDTYGKWDDGTMDTYGKWDNSTMDTYGKWDDGTMDTYGKWDNSTMDTYGKWDDPTMDPYGKWDNTTMDTYGKEDWSSPYDSYGKDPYEYNYDGTYGPSAGFDSYGGYGGYNGTDMYGPPSYGGYDMYGPPSYGGYDMYGPPSYGSYDMYGPPGGDDNYMKYEDSYASMGDEGMNIDMDLDDMGSIEMRQRGDKTKAKMRIRPIDVEVEAEMEGDETQVEVELDELDMKVKGKMKGDETSVGVRGDGYEMKATYGEEHDGMMVSTEMKFDQYFMYSMDNIDAKGNSAPACGPSTQGGRDPCKEITGSENTCCTHVVMTDQGSGKQNSFYRCMNEQVLDMSFQVEIDGMTMSMGCSGGYSSAKYIAGSIIASAAALTATLF